MHQCVCIVSVTSLGTSLHAASLLKGLKHANIVTLHDIIHTATNLTFVFEYVVRNTALLLEERHLGLQISSLSLSGHRSQSVHGEASWSSRSTQCATISLPAVERVGLLSQTEDPPPRPQATKLTHQ